MGVALGQNAIFIQFGTAGVKQDRQRRLWDLLREQRSGFLKLQWNNYFFFFCRICVITLAEAHPLLQSGKTIKNINYQISANCSRLQNKVSGKSKRVWLFDFLSFHFNLSQCLRFFCPFLERNPAGYFCISFKNQPLCT